MKNSGNMKYLLAILLILSALFAILLLELRFNTEEVQPDREVSGIKEGKTIVIAVVDTGFDFKSSWNRSKMPKPKVCKTGHKDFTGRGIADVHGHGTHISGLIAKYAEDSDYCLVFFKFFHTMKTHSSKSTATNRAFQRAIDLKVDVINFSGGGIERLDAECLLIKKALDMGIVVVAAAGNEASNINSIPYYPAMCDPRVVAVANVKKDGTYEDTSNFTTKAPGAVVLQEEVGENVLSLHPDNQVAVMSGTSQAAAIRTGKIVKKWKNK